MPEQDGSLTQEKQLLRDDKAHLKRIINHDNTSAPPPGDRQVC